MDATTLALALGVVVVLAVVVVVALIDVCIFAWSDDEIYVNGWRLGGLCGCFSRACKG